MDNLENDELGITVYGPCSYNAQYSGQEKYLVKVPCFNKIDRLFYHYKYNKIYNQLISNINVSEYEILHAHSLFANGYIAYKVFKNYKIPYIVAVRNTDANVFFKYFIHLRKLGIEILENASKIIFISNSYKEKLLNKYIPKSKREYIENKCIVIPNGIDNYFFKTEQNKKNIVENKVNLVYTGRVDENKNLITTIKCCDKFLKNKYDVSLNVIGPITSKRYNKIIRKYKFINYLGKKNKEEIVEIYKNMDIFVMPSKHETFGLTYVEAMSQGIPIIYTRNEGFDKFFDEGVVGYSIKYNDYKEMNEKIELILNKYDIMSKNCLKESQNFNWKDIALKYIEIYKEIIKRRKFMKTIVILSHVGFDNSPYCNYVHWHARELVNQGYNVIVIAAIRWVPILSNFQKRKKEFIQRNKSRNNINIIDGVKVIYKKTMTFSNFLYNSSFNLNGFFYYLGIKNIFKKVLKQEEVILVDAHTFKLEGYAAYKLKRKYNTTTTVTLHGTSFRRNTKSKNGRKLINKVLNNVDYTICVSDKLKKLAESCGVNNAKVILNGVNQYELDEIDKEQFKYKIISVGSLTAGKKHDITIKVISNLIAKFPNIELTIVGMGSEKQNLQKLIEENNLEDKVIFKSKIPNEKVLNLMNKSYIFLLPSVNEGFGISYVEAMQAKCITIGTKNEGIDGFIRNNENGFLVNPNVEEITALIEKIYNGEYNLDEIRDNAYNDSKNLTWEKNSKEYINLIKK